jgi:hypothetical protein
MYHTTVLGILSKRIHLCHRAFGIIQKQLWFMVPKLQCSTNPDYRIHESIYIFSSNFSYTLFLTISETHDVVHALTTKHLKVSENHYHSELEGS